MKKLVMAMLLSCIVIMSTGCNLQNVGNMDFLKSAGEKAVNDDAQKIIMAIENKDADAIKGMMADLALEEMSMQHDNIDEQIQELFDFYQGSMQSCEYKSGEETTRHGDEGDYGERIYRKAQGTYTVNTDEETYLLYVYHNVKSVTPEEEGVFCISLMKYSDYYDLNLIDYSWIQDIECGVHVMDATNAALMENLEKRLNDEGETGFKQIIEGYGRTLGCCGSGYHKGYNNQIDRFIEMFSGEVKIQKADAEKALKILDYNMGIGAEVLDSGFSDGEKIMYCEGVVYITDVNQEDYPSLYRAKMRWQKCEDDSKSGLTYFALMSEEDYQDGREFPDGEGIIILE